MTRGGRAQGWTQPYCARSSADLRNLRRFLVQNDESGRWPEKEKEEDPLYRRAARSNDRLGYRAIALAVCGEGCAENFYRILHRRDIEHTRQVGAVKHFAHEARGIHDL